jgi:hypothetical protein
MIGPILLAGLFFYLINMDGERFFYTFVKLEQQPIMNRITRFALLSIFCLCSCNSEKDNILPNPINEIEEEPCLWDAYVTKTVNQDSSIEFYSVRLNHLSITSENIDTLIRSLTRKTLMS